MVDAAISRVEKVNPELNAVILRLDDRARDRAARPLTGPFAGVPMLVKDLDGELAGAPLHLGNKLLKEIGYVATENSYQFDKFEQAGFVIIGKTNTPEFGLQITTESHAYGAARNPWNPNHSTGGSSGGSAAAVASGMTAVAHAGDGGGSIRVPSSECGLVGLKPSRGRVSVGPQDGEVWNGLVARHVVTRSVRDSAAVLDAIAGPMPGDPYTAPPPVRPFLAEVGADNGIFYEHMIKTKGLVSQFKIVGKKLSFDCHFSANKVATSGCTVAIPITYNLKEMQVINSGEIR